MSFLYVFLILIGSLQTLSGSAQTTTPITAIEQRFTEALMKKDAVAFDELLAADLVHIGFEGQIADKAQYMSFFKQGSWRYLKYEPADVRSKVLGNVAVVTGRVNRTIVIDNTETTGSFAFTHVWSRTGNRWRLTSSHVTTIPKAP